MLKVLGRKSSSNVQAVLWCLEELGLAYEQADAGFTYGVVNTPEYRSINPNGTVPTLIDGDTLPVWETGAILRYIATVYGDESFWPSDPAMRAQVDKWAEWSKINIAGKFTAPIFWRVVRTAPSKRDPVAIQQALENLDPYLAVGDNQLSRQPFIAGENFTLADIQLGHSLYRYFDIDISRKSYPNLRRYFDDLTKRAAFKETVMVSYDELRVFD